MNSSLKTMLQDLKSSSVWNYIFKFLIKWWCFAFVICKWPTLWINNKSSTNSNRYTIFIFHEKEQNHMLLWRDKILSTLVIKTTNQMITSCSWTDTKFKQAHSYHAYVGYNNINDMPNQDDDIINNQGDKCN